MLAGVRRPALLGVVVGAGGPRLRCGPGDPTPFEPTEKNSVSLGVEERFIVEFFDVLPRAGAA